MIILKFLSSKSRLEERQKHHSIESRLIALAELLNIDPLSALDYSIDLALSFKRNEIDLKNIVRNINLEKDYINSRIFFQRIKERIPI